MLLRYLLIGLLAATSTLASTARSTSETGGTSQPLTLGAESRTLSTRAALTTAAFERTWSGYEVPALRDAGIDDEKIESLKEVERDARAAWTAGERDVPRSLAQKREAILSPEELRRFRDAQRERRSKRHGGLVTAATAAGGVVTAELVGPTVSDSQTSGSLE